ncbi:serine/threonine-protein phosphatase 4 regulatory subunit 2-like [Helianthus annuus]|uniref:serine/threonine-protein phosphatase 4 regulatory subunit 2-like n=1 Tax=Helianthus annuus TaxID=4232 RepID=UPI000B8EF6BF|nr:serine/threonine-protein phosphatase 4 regulatory subunit 2-like [Helianthus annuus]
MDFDHIAYFELVDYALETKEYESWDFYMYGMDADNGDFKLFRDDKDVLELAMKAKNWSEPFIEVVEEPVHEASWVFDIDKETNLKEVVKESVKKVVQEEVFGQHSDKEADLEQDSEDSDYNEESSCDDDEDCYSDDDEVLEELVGLDSDREDFEWKQSQDAIKQATKDEEAATKKILEESIKHNEKEGNLHESNDAGCAHVEGYSNYEESGGDIATPGDSEEDDVRDKKFKETAPSVSAQTN